MGYVPAKGIAPKAQEYKEVGLVYAFNANDYAKSTPFNSVKNTAKPQTPKATFAQNLKTFGKRILKFFAESLKA